MDCNIYNMTDQERNALGIRNLPGTLHEALEEMKRDELVLDVLGKHLAGKYIEAKEAEWQKYRASVSEWEIQEYLYRY